MYDGAGNCHNFRRLKYELFEINQFTKCVEPVISNPCQCYG